MAYFPFVRRALLPVLLSSTLVACSADSLVPPSRIDSTTRVSSIQPRRSVAAPVQYSYQSTTTPVSSASVDYLDTPNLAGVGHASGTRRPLQTEDAVSAPETSAAGGGQAPRTSQSFGSSPVPAEGINMDAELGVGGKSQPVVGLAQEEDEQDIAEGQSEEPVVGGIGTDNPVQANRSLLRTGAQTQLSAAPRLQGQQVAMLPRVQNPMTTTEPQYDAPASPPPLSAAMPNSELQCRQELKQMGVVFQDKPTISQGPACQVPYPISLRGLSGNIAVKPAVTLNCQVTLAFAKWVKNELAPSARSRYWSGIGTIVPLGGYSCRRMNNSRQKYNPMSEHAHGNA
ncbi:MAG: extensin family protein, partial [Rhizobium sp.]